MLLNCLYLFADWNPQLFRELKGRLNVRNVTAEIVSFLLLQLTFLFGWQDNALSKFLWLNLMITFALLVVGSFLLISDFAQEEHRGTLNFIRFSPQSAQSILIGKMLGVPVLLYLAVLLTIPLNLGLGLSAHIPLFVIFCFYAVLVANCALFYSIALLFSLVSPWFSGLQAWLGGGAVLGFLLFTFNQSIHQSATGWLNLFSPSGILLYLVNLAASAENKADLSYYFFGANNHHLFEHLDISHWEWFNLPISATFLSLLIFTLLNYSFGTYWIWQALNRRFHNPHASLLSRKQSYILAACFAQAALGFALPAWQEPNNLSSQLLLDNFHALLSVNLLLIVSLIATLTPHRQACIDWVRYRRKKASALIQDLLWAENSPAIIAIAINLVITFVPMVAWILFWPVLSDGDNRMLILSGLILFLNLITIYAVLVQSMLLMKSPFRGVWAAGTVVATTLLPPLILSLLSINPGDHWGGLWLLTTYPWDALRYTSGAPVVQTILAQWSLFSLLIWQLTRQLHKIGNEKSLIQNSSRLHIN